MRPSTEPTCSMVEPLESRLFLRSVASRIALPVVPKKPKTPTATVIHSNVSAAATTASTTVDSVVFGNTASETAHALTSVSSQTVTGGLGDSARQLLPLSTVGVNGGSLTFTMAVDPTQRNYFTVKLWGSDDTDAGKGRLYLYQVVNGVNYQVGYRHEGDYAPLSVTADTQTLPGRFLYSTTLLPLSMTQGKTSITLTIQSTGELYGLGTTSGTTGGTYQDNMDEPSRGIYEAYTHTQPMLDVSGETQGTAPATTIAPAVSASSVLGSSGTFTTRLEGWVSGRLSAANTDFDTSDVEMLAHAYSVPQLTNAYHSTTLVNKVISVIDSFATDYFTNPVTSVTGADDFAKSGGNEVWGGRFGLLGWAIHELSSDATFQSSLDTVVNYGSAGGNQTRRAAWSAMLVASRDSGRFNRDSRYLTNQSILADMNIYRANEGLIDLGSSSAFTEAAGQRYLEESAGLIPWTGSDLPGGGSSYKYGSNYYQVTPAGLTREWGYAGGYSEMALQVAEMYRMTGNTAFQAQADKMALAMAYFRRPAILASGSNDYQTMEREGVIAWRGVREADGYVSNDIAYAGPANFASGLITAAATGDPTLIGYAKQMLNDNQYLNQLTSNAAYYKSLTFDSLNVFDAFADYNTITADPDSGARLPLTPGQPDTSFSDPQDGVAVIKHGSNILYIEPYWQAKTGTGTNGIGRFDYTTANYEQYGDFEESDVQYTSDGSYFVRPNLVDQTQGTTFQPPDNPQQAYAGEKLPIPSAPGDAKDDTPYRGKVNFYAFRFGNYLFGMNTTSASTYTLNTPNGFTSATDLMTGNTDSGTISVGPDSTVALYLPSSVDTAPVPTAPLLLTATGAATGDSLSWSTASGATSYNVERSTNASGPYITIATNVTGTTYSDTAVSHGQTYYYVVSAVNGNGESYNSSQASTNAGLPTAWTNTDVGTVTLLGSTSDNAGTFTLRGSGSDVGGSSDSFQFAYTSLSGNGSIIARVTDAMYTNGADKIGIMLRESTAANSKNVALSLTNASETVNLNVRSSTGGSTTSAGSLNPIGAPYWLKLTRSGSTITAAVSPDGTTWTTVATATVTLNTALEAGLFVCSRYSQQLNASTFDNVSVTGVDTTSPTLTSVVSRKTQGSTGTFDLPLPLTGTPTIEPRQGGTSTLVFTFSEPVADDDGTLSANEFTITNAIFGSATLSGVTLVLNLLNVVDQARTSVAIQGLEDAAGNQLAGTNSVTIRDLYGDVNQNGTVNVGDILLTQQLSGQQVTQANYLFDVNLSGTLNVADILLIQARSGGSVV